MLLFFDIDGTLISPGHPPSEATVQAIRKARANGHKVFLSTGRSEVNVPSAVRSIGFDGGIYSAGGRVVVGDTLLTDQPMSREMARDIWTAMEEENLDFGLECAEKNYNRIAGLAVSAESSTELQRIFALPGAAPLDEYEGEPIYKLIFIAKNVKQIDALASRLDDSVKLVHFENFGQGQGQIVGEVSDKRINKGAALRTICSYFNVDPSQCIAFGDSMNDAEILFAAGLGIAMGNAEPRLKELADLVCDSCENDGVAKALALYGLV